MMEEKPCKIDAYSTAKPSKHGSAKTHVEARGVFNNKKRSLSQPVDTKVWAPIIEQKQGQAISITGEDVQIVDLETYQTFTTHILDGEDLNPEDEIEYLEYEDQRKII